MSFTSQLLANSTSGLSVSERVAQAQAALERGQSVDRPLLYDRINRALGEVLSPDRSRADEYAKRYIDNSYLDGLRDALSPDRSRADEYAKRYIDNSYLDGLRDALSPDRSRADEYASRFINPDATSDVFDYLVDGFKTTSSASSGATYSANRRARNSAKTVDYLEADLAKHYGMDAKTAYGEALQNTAYQRAVADLKAAGLNPVLAVSGLNPAGSYVSGNTLSRASGSGSSGAVSSASGKYAMSSNLYNAVGAAASIIGAVVGYKTGHGSFKFMNAATVSQLSKNLVQSAIQGYGSLFGSE